jgi:polyhydroxybutyrate depolymerase
MRKIAGLVIALLVALGIALASAGTGGMSDANAASSASAATAANGDSSAWAATGGSGGSGGSSASAATAATGAKSAGAAAGGGAASGVTSATKTYPTTSKTYSMKVLGLKRSWEVVAPTVALPKTAPVIVMLSGLGATVAKEMARDQLTPYASADKAEIVYPVAFGESWNAIGCCKLAGKDRIPDLAFLQALVPTLDPGHKRPIYLVGYSNGARLGYRVVCTDPKLFDGYAMVKGGPMPGCVVSKPVNIEQLASTDDLEVPYNPGGKGAEKLSALAIVAELRAADKCGKKSVVSRTGDLVLNNWENCATGKYVGFAVWKTGKHAFPRPPVSNPGAAPVIWAFFTRTRLAPLP